MSEPETSSRWDPQSEEARNLLRRAEGLWNRDYFERIVVPLFRLPDGGRVADIGTGYGALAFLLSSVRPDASITGTDPEIGLIAAAAESAERLGLDRVRFVSANGASLPFADGELDLVMCQTVLIHVPDAAAVVREMARVLRPGGVFFAAEWTDRAAASAPFFFTAWPPNDADELDGYRLTKLFSRGREMLGRGDDRAGHRGPLLAVAAGLRVFDIRRNDRVDWTMPPYGDPKQLAVLADERDWAATDAPDDEFRAWSTGNIIAGGGTEADVARFFDLGWSPQLLREARAQLEAGTYGIAFSRGFVLTFAEKPA